MRLTLSLCLCLMMLGSLLSTPILSAQEPATGATDKKDQWISLFDGDSMQGWEKVGSKDSHWEVKDGALAGSGAASMLVCTQPVLTLISLGNISEATVLNKPNS